jgi:hypothetical protein
VVLETQVNALASAVGADVKAIQAARDLPSYLTDPYSVKHRFDPTLGIYNLKRSNMRKFQAAAARAQAGLAPLEVVWVAASFGAGALSATTWNRPKSPPMAMRNEIGRRGIPVGGTGYVRFADSGATAIDPRVVYTGSGWNANSKWYVFTPTQNDLVTITDDLTGDRFKLTFLDLGDGSTFSISVDGATTGAGFTTVTNNAAGVRTVTLSTPIKVGSTIVVKKTSAGGNMAVMGWQVYNNAVPGVIVHNLSQSGSSASGTGTTAWADTSANTSLGQLIADPTKITASGSQPALVVIDLGTNDIKTPTSASDATVTAALTTVRSKFPSSDVLFNYSAQVEDSLISASRWEAFGRSMYAYVDSLDVPLFDVRSILGNYSTMVANGQSTDGIGHVLAEVSEMIGRIMAAALALPFGNVDTPKILVGPTGTLSAAGQPDNTTLIEYTP